MTGQIFVSILQLFLITIPGHDCSGREEAQIPQKVVDYIEKQFPSFQIAKNNDFVYDWCIYYSDTISSPYYVKGNFDNDKENEYCLIIKSEDRKDYKIIIIDKDDKGFKSYTVIQTPDPNRQYWLDDYKFDFGLVLNKPDSISIQGENDKVYSLEIKTEFIRLKAFEKSERIIYWTEEKYKTIINGD